MIYFETLNTDLLYVILYYNVVYVSNNIIKGVHDCCSFNKIFINFIHKSYFYISIMYLLKYICTFYKMYYDVKRTSSE